MTIYAYCHTTPQLPSAFDAKVHSVFNHAVNLSLQKTNHITTILKATDILYPGCLCLKETTRTFRDIFHPGQLVSYNSGKMILGETGERIDTSNAKLIDCKLAHLTISPSQYSLTIYEMLSALMQKHITHRFKNDSKLQIQLQIKLEYGLACLITAVIEQDNALALNAIRQLVALGMGLTPSGDDILVGFLAGLRTNQELIADHETFLQKFTSDVLLLLNHTNVISQQYLLHAVNGYFSTAIIALLTAISSGKSITSIEECAKKLLTIGHTSGVDILAGLFGALSILYKSHIISNKQFSIFNHWR